MSFQGYSTLTTKLYSINDASDMYCTFVLLSRKLIWRVERVIARFSALHVLNMSVMDASNNKLFLVKINF